MYLIYLQGNLKFGIREYEDSNNTKDTEKVKYDTPPTKTSWPTGSSFLLIIKMKRKKLRLILYKVVSLKEIFCSKISS